MWRTAGSKPAPASSAPPVLRLCLGAAPSHRTALDGGWWPRSAGPVAELPGLIRAIDDRYGRVTRLMLAQAASLIRVPEILATLTSPAQPAETELELSLWESEGGRLTGHKEAI